MSHKSRHMYEIMQPAMARMPEKGPSDSLYFILFKTVLRGYSITILYTFSVRSATMCQEYSRLTVSCIFVPSIVLCLLMAISTLSISYLGLAGASQIISGGSTSEIPPTSVLTQRRPQLAASRIAMQKASVRLVFKKICPLQSTSLT